jgi:hypothetical protein
MADRLPIPTVTPTNDYPTATPGFAGAIPDSNNEAEWSPWINMKGFSTWYHVVESTEKVFIEFDGRSNPPLVRGQGRFGRLGFTSKQFRIATKTAQTVRMAFGDVEDYDVTETADGAAVFEPFVFSKTSDAAFTVDLSGYVSGTFSVQYNAPGYLAIPVTTAGYQDYANVYSLTGEYLGRADGKLALAAGSYRLDLTGVTEVLFFPSSDQVISFQADREPNPTPLEEPRLVQNNTQVNNFTGPNSGGKESGVFHNVSDKTFAFHGTFVGTGPWNLSLQPVDANGNTYDGTPGYVTVNGPGEVFLVWDLVAGNARGDQNGVVPLVVNPLSVANPLPMGAFDYVLKVATADAAWSITEMSTAQSR